MRRPRVGLACMTQRGVRVLEKLIALQPTAELAVITAEGESWEPSFVDDLRRLALAHGGRFHLRERKPTTATTTAGASKAGWNAADLDLLLLVNWRSLLPAAMYAAPARGTFVLHDSLLPRYRGFSPTSWAIINGEAQTGATLFAIAEAMDAGDIIGQRNVPIAPEDTVATVMAGVTDAYLALLEDHLGALLAGTATRRPQEHGLATYGCKRTPDDNRIDWTTTTRSIHNLVRGVTAPYPGAFTTIGGRVLRVWSARPDPEPRRYAGRIPGAVAEVRRGQGVVVLTGDGSLLLERVQLAGEPAANAWDVLSSLAVRLGLAAGLGHPNEGLRAA